ncbi:YraN family protein [Corynebacterium sp. 32222D000AT]|uniref:YraN family protein n=1 Tax=unclassified Corynebacterium TaxID=2624378 RepID=UPI0034CE0CA4
MHTAYTRNHALARRGEAYAAQFYRRRGGQVLAHNVHYAVGEIDLVVLAGDTVIFVEVKTRSRRDFGVAEAVSPRKLARLRKAARLWLKDKPFTQVRFDVVALVTCGAGFELEHYPGVDDGAR